MNNKRRDVDTLLHNALQNDESPDERLIRKLKHELSLLKEDSELKTKTTRRPLSMVATIAVIIALATGGVYAAWNFLSPSDVANEFEHNILAEAFQSEDALLIDRVRCIAPWYRVRRRPDRNGRGRQCRKNLRSCCD